MIKDVNTQITINPKLIEMTDTHTHYKLTQLLIKYIQLVITNMNVDYYTASV